jgi:hypothetical protein
MLCGRVSNERCELAGMNLLELNRHLLAVTAFQIDSELLVAFPAITSRAKDRGDGDDVAY